MNIEQRDRPAVLQDDPDTLDDPTLSFFLDYWRSKITNRTLPSWRDFSPSEVRSHLRWLIVVDALPEYVDFRYRVVGTSVCDYFLSNGTGKTVAQAFEGMHDTVHAIVGLYKRACLKEKPVRFTSPASIVAGIFFPSYDSLYVPYLSEADGGCADRVVGAFVFDHGSLGPQRNTPASRMTA